MHRRLVFVSLSILVHAAGTPLIGLSQTPKAPPRSPGPIRIVELSITSISPANPVVGQKITVNYSASTTVAVTGNIAGIFQDIPLQQPNGGSAATVTIAAFGMVTGSLVVTAPKAGQGAVTLGLYPPPPSGCSDSLQMHLRRCRIYPIATASASLMVVPPTVIVRISGTTYSHIAEPDKDDNASANNGYLCVLHDPGCGWWGNDGKDKYFAQKQLPAGAELVGVDFIQYWPLGVDSASGSGAFTWLNSSGSYFAHLNQDNPAQPYVKWNNTCWAGFGGKNLRYSVSFRIQMPHESRRTDVGCGHPVSLSCSRIQFKPRVCSGGRRSGPKRMGRAGRVLQCRPGGSHRISAYSGESGHSLFRSPGERGTNGSGQSRVAVSARRCIGFFGCFQDSAKL